MPLITAATRKKIVSSPHALSDVLVELQDLILLIGRTVEARVDTAYDNHANCPTCGQERSFPHEIRDNIDRLESWAYELSCFVSHLSEFDPAWWAEDAPR